MRKTGWEGGRAEPVPFGDGVASLFLRCNGMLNVRTRYVPEPGKAAQMPRTPRPSKLSLVHIQSDALARAAFFRPNMGWAETDRLLARNHYLSFPLL